MTWSPDSPDDVANELATYQEAFDAAPIPEGGGGRNVIPDGTYQARIHTLAVKRSGPKSKNPGTLMLEWHLKILGPSCQGEDLRRWNHFGTQENLGFLKKDLAICGIQVGNLATLESQLIPLIDKVVEITAKTNGQYQNVYLNALVVRAPDAPPADDPDVPF